MNAEQCGEHQASVSEQDEPGFVQRVAGGVDFTALLRRANDVGERLDDGALRRDDATLAEGVVGEAGDQELVEEHEVAPTLFVARMQRGLQVFARNQPVNVLIATMRSLAAGEAAPVAGQALAWTALLFVVSIPLALRLYRRRT